MAKFIEEACSAAELAVMTSPDQVFLPSRILHSLGTAIEATANSPNQTLGEIFPGIAEVLSPGQERWLSVRRLELFEERPANDWARQARAQAFEHLQRTIVGSGEVPKAPENALRSDEIVWGRAPVRLDLAGGWTDTPPCSLEHGGCVANAAVILNGQPPIQVYARVTAEPCIRIHSIDLGTDCDIREWDELLDYRSATGEFSLAKAALVLAGFTPAACPSPNHALKDLLDPFGGGLELTTLAAVPKGSGLGTSSVMGAVVLAVIHRVLGRELSSTGLFHAVLRLEQALTTGGGWQDQIGGALGGVKLITTRPGLVPDPTVRYLPPDVLDPKANAGQTLLYYTGITRLAKNILAQVVGPLPGPQPQHDGDAAENPGPRPGGGRGHGSQRLASIRAGDRYGVAAQQRARSRLKQSRNRSLDGPGSGACLRGEASGRRRRRVLALGLQVARGRCPSQTPA